MERKQSNKLKRLRETAEEFWNLAETQWTAPAPRLENNTKDMIHNAQHTTHKLTNTDTNTNPCENVNILGILSGGSAQATRLEKNKLKLLLLHWQISY